MISSNNILLNMSRKTSAETIELIKNLYTQDLTIAEISTKANVSHATVYSYTKLTERINPETEKRFETVTEYKNYLATQKTNPETGELFKSKTEYENYLAMQKINPETKCFYL